MKILVTDDNREFNAYLSTVLQGMGHQTVCAYSAAEALSMAAAARPEAAMLDLDLPDLDGLGLLARMLGLLSGLHVIIITGGPSLESAVRAIKLGAENYIQKPLNVVELRRIIAAVEARVSPPPVLERLRALGAPDLAACHLAGDEAMLAVYTRVLQVSGKDRIPVLVGGETGVGKQHVARLVHLLSPRAGGPFVEINCAAMPEPLLEAELFGYEPGAFTDARKAKPGLFEAAQGGTLFLDEVGDMSLGMQAKLLKVLEQKSSRRLGGLREQAFDVRVVAASNRDLAADARAGRFRADLFYRLSVFPVLVPPLRGRGAAIRGLSQHFYDQACRDYGRRVRPLSEPVLQRLSAFSWPGNVRELKGHIERMVVEEEGGPQPAEGPAAPAMDEERDRLSQLLAEHRWNRSKVAKALGVSRPTLLSRMKRHGLSG